MRKNLIVDDASLIRLVADKAAKEARHETVLAENADEGLAALENNQVDLIRQNKQYFCMNRFRESLFCIFLLTVLISYSSAESLPEFEMYTEDWFPFQYVKDKKLEGFSVDLLSEILAELGSHQDSSHMFIIPWARAVKFLNKQNTLVFSMTVTKERLHKYQWVGPIYDIDNVVIVKKNANISTLDFTSDNMLRTAVIIDDLGFKFFKQLNINGDNVEKVTNGKSPLLMLQRNRIDFVIDNWLNFKEIAKRNNADLSEFKVLTVLERNKISYALSKTTNPYYVEQMNNALIQLKKNGRYDVLKKRYNLD